MEAAPLAAPARADGRDDAKFVVLTHRSRREARRILQAAGLDAAPPAGVVAAEDLVMVGFRHAPKRMFKHGLRKNLALFVLGRSFGVDRSRQPAGPPCRGTRLGNARTFLPDHGSTVSNDVQHQRQHPSKLGPIGTAINDRQPFAAATRDVVVVSLGVFNVACRMGNVMRLVFLERLQ
jgi:hypothetical protein